MYVPSGAGKALTIVRASGGFPRLDSYAQVS